VVLPPDLDAVSLVLRRLRRQDKITGMALLDLQVGFIKKEMAGTDKSGFSGIWDWGIRWLYLYLYHLGPRVDSAVAYIRRRTISWVKGHIYMISTNHL
jgi:hypothetical protein